jgi:hypothetical protein
LLLLLLLLVVVVVEGCRIAFSQRNDCKGCASIGYAATESQLAAVAAAAVTAAAAAAADCGLQYHL